MEDSSEIKLRKDNKKVMSGFGQKVEKLLIELDRVHERVGGNN